MELCLTLDHRFFQTPEGCVWTVTQCAYPFYAEYLDVFDSVRIIARCFPVDRAAPDFLAVEGPRVRFFAMPSYKGPYQFLANSFDVARQAREAVPPGAAVLFRAPSQVANSVERTLYARNHPFAVEVVADPYDVFSPAADSRFAAPIARRYFKHSLRATVKRAVAVSYVTQSYLQRRYPTAGSATQHGDAISEAPCRKFSIGVSDANLTDDAFCNSIRTRCHHPEKLRVVFVGTLGSLYKGPDTLVRAIAICRAQGLRVEARFAGDGRERVLLERLAAQLEVADRITFLGDVQAGRRVREELDWADLFVLPSRAEGLPRAMLEAMARALPCIGSTIGGIPELLDNEDLAPTEDPGKLAAKFVEIVTEEGRIARMSQRNLATAQRYTKSALSARRRLFLEAVRQGTEEHFARHPS